MLPHVSTAPPLRLEFGLTAPLCCQPLPDIDSCKMIGQTGPIPERLREVKIRRDSSSSFRLVLLLFLPHPFFNFSTSQRLTTCILSNHLLLTDIFPPSCANMSISLSDCPEPGGGTPWLKPLAGTLSTDEDTRPSSAPIPSRIDNWGLLWVAPKTADCTREHVTSSGHSSMTPDYSAMPVASKTSAKRSLAFKDVADAFATCKRILQGIEWLLNSEQGEPIQFSDDDDGNESTNQSCLSDFMVDHISGMAPSHAQLCHTRFEMAYYLECLHSSANLSTAGHVLDAFCSETLENVRGLKAPLLEQEQLLGFDCGWNMYDRERQVETMVLYGNRASMAMRLQSHVQSLEMTELFMQGNLSSSFLEAFWKIKHLSDLTAQLLSLRPYYALLMVRACHRTTSLTCPWLTNS